MPSAVEAEMRERHMSEPGNHTAGCFHSHSAHYMTLSGSWKVEVIQLAEPERESQRTAA